MAKKSKIENNKRKFGTIQYVRRCNICGRPKSVIRMFGICRLCFRKLAGEGQIPGVVKSSW